MSKEDNKEKKFEIKPRVRNIADRIKSLEGAGIESNGTFRDNDTFRKIATQDGRNVDQMIDDDDYRSDFIAGTSLACGEIGNDFHRDNKDAGTLSGTFEIGRNRLEVSVERHQRVPNRVLDKETGNFRVEGEKDLYGDLNVKYTVRGARNSRGDLKAVREFVSNMYTGTHTPFSS